MCCEKIYGSFFILFFLSVPFLTKSLFRWFPLEPSDLSCGCVPANPGLVEIMAESERSPYRNGVSGRSGLPKDENEAASSAAQPSNPQGDMTDVPPSTASKPTTSQIPKLAASSIPTPTISASTSTNNSAVSSREPSPIRPSLRAGTSNSTSQLPPLSRKNSQDRSPPRSNPAGQSPNPAAAAVQQASSQTGKPPVFSPPAAIEPSANDSDSDKSNMAAWAASRRAEQESYLANTSSKRATLADDDGAKGDRSVPRAVNRGLSSGSGAPLETVQETASDQSTPSADTVLNHPAFEESRLQKIEEDTTPKALKQIGTVESGSDSGGNKSSDPKEDQRRRASSSGGTRKDAIIPKRSTTSLSGARGKPADGSARNMIVETETVSSIPQVSLSAATGDRGHSGRADHHQGTLRLKPSTETIRPKKEKKRTRKPAPLPNGAASSKADIFEAKVASAVDEADVSDSDETFVYESNPPDPYPARSRYHSRTPSATSMASQADQFAGRARPPLRDNNHSVTGKRSMKFTNNTYNSSVDGDVPDEGRGGPGMHDGGTSSHTPRHHHLGRNGRTNTYTSLFDSDSPFPQAQSYIKSPRHFIGSGFRQSKHPGSRGPMNYRTINKKNGDAFSYDFDAEGADDERTPLVGSPRVPRSRHGGRRPNSASLRQMEYMQRRHGWISRYGVCVVISVLLFLVIALGTTFIVAVTKPLQTVKVAAIQNVLASEQELMLDLNVLAVNPNLFPVTVDNLDINIFAKSRYVGTDSLWREYGNALYDTPRVDRSKKRAELARAARCVGCSTDELARIKDGIDHGTDPISPDPDPVGDPQTMLLGRVFGFDSPLAFEPSPWKHLASSSKGQIRLQRPGNKTEEGGTERWERVLQHPFDLIVRGVIKYQLPMSSRYVSSSVSSSVKVTPDKDDNGDGHTHDPKPPKNDTVAMSVPSALLRRRLLLSRQLRSEQGASNTNITQRTFMA